MNKYEPGFLIWFLYTLFYQVLDFITDILNASHIVTVALNFMMNEELTMYSV
jgi:hypothetical protein